MDIQRIASPPPIVVRAKSGHKGVFGRLLIIGGSDAMLGAPVLAGTAALRMGAGLVQIAVPRAMLSAALSVTPELVGLGFARKSSKNEFIEAADAADAIVIGPGLGKAGDAGIRLKRIVGLYKPIVVDADGLNLLSHEKRWPKWFKSNGVLTPHPGEMKRLGKLIGRSDVPTDNDGRIELAIEAARAFGQVMVLKGDRTVVTDGQRLYVNRTGDSSLSKAGTGDVLSGIVGAFLAQKMDHFDAACMGVYLHGRAGELAGEKLGMRSVLARDVIDMLHLAIGEYEKTHGTRPGKSE
jgi:NAD(P)H-hydrate epimerase